MFISKLNMRPMEALEVFTMSIAKKIIFGGFVICVSTPNIVVAMKQAPVESTAPQEGAKRTGTPVEGGSQPPSKKQRLLTPCIVVGLVRTAAKHMFAPPESTYYHSPCDAWHSPCDDFHSPCSAWHNPCDAFRSPCDRCSMSIHGCDTGFQHPSDPFYQEPSFDPAAPYSWSSLAGADAKYSWDSNASVASGATSFAEGSSRLASGSTRSDDGPAPMTVASRSGSLVKELTFEQQLEKITARSQRCITCYGDGQPLMVLDHTIVTNLSDLALQYDKMGKHDQAFDIGELSAWTSKACLLYARAVKAGVVVAQEGGRWADGVPHVVDKGFMDQLDLTAEMATTATKVGIAAGKVALIFLGDQEGLANELKARFDRLAGRAQRMSKEEHFMATVATGCDVLGLCIASKVADDGMAVEASALTASLSNLKIAILTQAEIAATMVPALIAEFAPMVKACKELPGMMAVAAKIGQKQVLKTLNIIGKNPRLVQPGEPLVTAVEKVLAAEK